MKKYDEWLEAYKQTLNQYLEGTHTIKTDTCPKCLIVSVDCTKCPEDIFRPGSVGCLHRPNSKTENSVDMSDSHLFNVITYHKNAIAYLENNPDCSKKNFKKYLLTIG